MSLAGLVANVIPVPATIVNVSVVVSAAIVVCPLTAKLLNAFWLVSPPPPPTTVAGSQVPAVSSHAKTCPSVGATEVVSTSLNALILNPPIPVKYVPRSLICDSVILSAV